MSKGLLVFAALALFALAAAELVASENDFRAFMGKYGKAYPTQQEYYKRFEIFVENAAKNAWRNSLKTGATYGVNAFADMSEEEFRMKYLHPLPMDEYRPQYTQSLAKIAALPTAFDWRNATNGFSAVTHVKNQGQCGSCWSFSTTGNVEGQYAIKTKTLLSFSEQQLLDCDTVDQACNGGLPSNAYQYIMQAGGIEGESQYPYEAEEGTCQYRKSEVLATVANWTALPTDEGELAQWLFQNGPISIGINAEWMQTYVGGISDPLFCDPSSLDHGVLIVGYGVGKSILGFQEPFWIIKNSWGTSWGEDGYYRIIRGKGKCGLNTMATSATGVN